MSTKPGEVHPADHFGDQRVTIVQYIVADDDWELEVTIDGFTYPRMPVTTIKPPRRLTKYFIIPYWKEVPDELKPILLQLGVIKPKNGNDKPSDRSPVQVHRLVAGLCFCASLIDPKTGDRLEVHHQNYNGLDNRINNLEPMTSKEHYLRHRREGQARKVPMDDYNEGILPEDKATVVAQVIDVLTDVEADDHLGVEPDFGELFEEPVSLSAVDHADWLAFARQWEQAMEANLIEMARNVVDYGQQQALEWQVEWALLPAA